MEISVIFVVLGAAFLHAFWNFQVRGSEDKALGMAAVVFGHLPLAILGLAFVGLPISGSWPYIIASAVLHLGCRYFCRLPIWRFNSNLSCCSRCFTTADNPFHHDTVPDVLQTMEVLA